MQAPDSRPARGTWMGPSPPLASLSGTTERAARTARLPVITSARASAVRNRDDDPCRRRRRAATCGGLGNGRVILAGGLRNRRSGAGYLIRLFSAVETLFLASGAVVRTAKIRRT